MPHHDNHSSCQPDPWGDWQVVGSPQPFIQSGEPINLQCILAQLPWGIHQNLMRIKRKSSYLCLTNPQESLPSTNPTAVTRLPRWRRQNTRLQVRPFLTMLQDMERCDFWHANRYWIGLACGTVIFGHHVSEWPSEALEFSGGRRVT